MSLARIITIERHILDVQSQHPEATGAFTNLLYDIALAAKIITRETTRAGLVNILGRTGGVNYTGDEQKKLDVFAHDIMVRMNDHTGRLCVMASEEHTDIIPIPEHYPSGHYVLIFDPLDGSSNVDVNGSLGTIFAIYRKISKGARGTLEDVLQPGLKLAAAGYIIYGPCTMLVYSTGSGVYGFTYDPSLGEFLLSHDHLKIPAKPVYYSCNQGHEKTWTPGARRYITWLQGMDEEETKPLNLRYSGCLVADFHRILLDGGVYIYPQDVRTPAGKLRLTYEAAPLAYLAEQAGGYASDGLGSIMQLQPTTLHQRVPLYIGNRALVEKAEQIIRAEDHDWIATYAPMRQAVERA